MASNEDDRETVGERTRRGDKVSGNVFTLLHRTQLLRESLRRIGYCLARATYSETTLFHSGLSAGPAESKNTKESHTTG